MTNVTKTVYVGKVNTLRTTPAARSPAVNGTDVSRASAQSITIAAPNTVSTAVTGDLSGSTIVGDDMRSLLVSKAREWSRIRKVRYRLTGNVSPAGSTYDRFGHITSPTPGTSVPGTGNAIYDIFDAGEDIDESDVDNLISTLKIIVNNDTLTLQHNPINYCHSQCHSSCHSSRGRR